MEEAGATQDAANREEQKAIPTSTAQAAERRKDEDSRSKEDLLPPLLNNYRFDFLRNNFN